MSALRVYTFVSLIAYTDISSEHVRFTSFTGWQNLLHAEDIVRSYVFVRFGTYPLFGARARYNAA